jgi:hypothetical protein
MSKKKIVVYICENGHPQEVETDKWTHGTPKQMICWERWEDDICGKYAKPLDRV